MATRVPAPVVSTSRKATALGVDRLDAAARQRVAGRLERCQVHRVGGVDVQQRSDRRQPVPSLVWVDGEQRVGELRAAGRDLGSPPVTLTAGQCVVENVCPVLELEV